VWKRDTESDWFSRDTYYMSGYIIDEPMVIRPDDLDHDDAQVVVDPDVQNDLCRRRRAQVNNIGHHGRCIQQ
jgi:hypothetical protein